MLLQTVLNAASPSISKIFARVLIAKINCYKWWAEAKKIAQISKKRAIIPTLVDDCGDAACDSSKVEALARCFKIQFSPNPSFDPCATTLPPAQFTPDLQFQLPNITQHEIFRKLRTLPKNKSVGGDITNVILREVAPVITQSLCHLFNTSLRLGQLPSDWKLATVIPICQRERQTCGAS